jgi:TolB-like protein/Flp pilus assembly protein TadD
MDRLRAIIHEIHRRSLWQVLGIYVVASWAVLQVVETLTSTLALPDWFPQFAFVLLLIGLPIVLATAFVQEGGLRSDEREVPRPVRRAPSSGLFTWRNAIAGGVLAFALWGVVAAGWLVFGDRSASTGSFVAVLPFDNLSPDPDHAYFAAGVHEEILTHLARIAVLDVISRTSVLEYAGQDRNLREIAAELGDVTHVVEGSVRRDGDRIRVTVQLIDARTDDHVWAEVYDRDISDVFAVQADIAERVAEELGARLAPAELARIESPPTEDQEAYTLYLQALEAPSDERLRLLEQAIARDPAFALAYAALAETHVYYYWWREDRTEERLRASEVALNRALELDPTLPQAHMAAGLYHYWGHRDYVSAAIELTLAAEGLPNDAQVHNRLGNVFRRSGKWEEAVSSYEKAVELDPRAPLPLADLGQTQALMRRFDDAEATFARWEALQGFPHLFSILALALHRGDGDRAELMLDRRPQERRGPLIPFLYASAFLLQGDYQRAAEVLERATNVLWPSAIWSRSLFLAEIHGLLEQPERAAAHYDSARVYLEEEAALRPSDDRVYGALGIAYAGLGRSEDAVEAALHALDLAPPERDAFQGMSRIVDLATVYAMVGDFDAALERLEWLLANPSSVNVGRLRREPRWDPIREDPRFQELLERYDTSGP